MAFFHNRTLNLLNLHYVTGSIAQSGGGAFFAVYLLRSGMSVPAVLVSLTAIFAMRLISRIFLLPLAIRLGLRWTVILGVLLMAASFPFLIGVHGVGRGLYLLVIVTALADTVYWPSYHAYFAALGDEDHRGQQIGLREAVVAILGIISPLATGWLLVTFGAAAAFIATSAVQVLSAIPLLWTPNVTIARHAPGGFRAALPGATLFVGDGLIAAGYFIVWQIALFIALDQSYLAYGGALAIAAFVGAVGGLLLGRLIDSGKGNLAVWYSVSLLVFVIAMRAGVLRYPVFAVGANALGSLVACLYVPTLMTAVYNQAKRSPCVMRFHIASEGGWDVGVSVGLMAAALLTWFGFSISLGILTSLVGALSVFVALRRYYAQHDSDTINSALTAGEFQIQPGDSVKI